MKITSERVGDTIVIEVCDGQREITLMLDLQVAEKLGTTLIAQACLASDGLDLPADLQAGGGS